jgi:nitrile hydratase accessory protein
MEHAAGAIHDLLPQGESGPVFSEPWEAQAFALAVRLSESGHFGWTEWALFLSQEIKAARERGDSDLGDTYYHYWLGALEQLCLHKGLIASEDLRRRKAEWLRAYLHTPHGEPVVISRKG